MRFSETEANTLNSVVFCNNSDWLRMNSWVFLICYSVPLSSAAGPGIYSSTGICWTKDYTSTLCHAALIGSVCWTALPLKRAAMTTWQRRRGLATEQGSYTLNYMATAFMHNVSSATHWSATRHAHYTMVHRSWGRSDVQSREVPFGNCTKQIICFKFQRPGGARINK